MQDNEKREVDDEDEINLLYLLVVILKRKKMIAVIVLVFILIAVVRSLGIQPKYLAETTILPPQQSNSNISQILRLSAASNLTAASLRTVKQNEVYVGMLKSRTIYDYIIDRFSLMESYKAKYKENARKKLAGSVTIKNRDDGIISLSVRDKDPRKAADIANAFIDKLKEMNQTFAITEASKKRLFYEEQLAKVKEALGRSEAAMQNFQKKTGVIKIEAQAEAVIGAITDLSAKIAAKEVELKVMKTYAEPRNPDLQKSEEAVMGMKEQLQKLKAKSEENQDLLVSTGSISEVSSDYAKKLRELKYNENLFEIMSTQYEAACMDEARDAIIIQVIDKAEPPAKSERSNLRLNVALAGVVGFFLAIFAAFFMEFVERVSGDPENKELIGLIKKYSFFGKGK